MDITKQHQARAALEKRISRDQEIGDQLRIIIDTIPTLALKCLCRTAPPDSSIALAAAYGSLSREARWGWTVAIQLPKILRS